MDFNSRPFHIGAKSEKSFQLSRPSILGLSDRSQWLLDTLISTLAPIHIGTHFLIPPSELFKDFNSRSHPYWDGNSEKALC